MPAIECYDLRGQIFTHVDSKTGVNTVYAVTDLRRACDHYILPLYCITIEREDVEMVKRLRGIEPYRVRRAMQSPRWLPLLFAMQPDDTYLMIDGSHTLVARWMLGHTQANAYVIPERIWRHYTVEGMPTWNEEQLARSWSGIT